MEADTDAASKTKQPCTDTAPAVAVKCSSGSGTQWLPLAEMFLTTLIAINMSAVFATLYGTRTPVLSTESPDKRENRPTSFYDSDGSTPYEEAKVSDIIHIVRYNETELTFMDVVFLRSMYLNHRPNTIMVHCSPCGFTGPFVDWTEGINLTFVPHDFPREVIHNSTDVARIRILMEYGGIYLDWDVFVVKSLRRLLRYEATLAIPPGQHMGNSFMIFHENSRFLKLYHEIYREFNDSQGSYNATEQLTIQLAHLHPHLINRMYYTGLQGKLDMIDVAGEQRAYPDWRDAYAIHTHSYPRNENWRNLNEPSSRESEDGIGEMARSVLFGTSDLVGREVPVLSVTELAGKKDNGDDLTKMTSRHAKPFSGI